MPVVTSPRFGVSQEALTRRFAAIVVQMVEHLGLDATTAMLEQELARARKAKRKA